MTKGTERPRLIVFDANFAWTEKLFTACGASFEVLLVKPRELRSYRTENGRWRSDSTPRKLAEHVWEIRLCLPPGWLFHFWGLARRWLTHKVRFFLRPEADTLLVLSYPHYLGLEDALGVPFVYYAVDDYREYWPGRRTQTESRERKMAGLARAIFCTARRRQEDLQPFSAPGAPVVHLPHASEAGRTPPMAREKKSAPRAGYIGALNDRFDFSLLAGVAARLPEVRFILGGKPPDREELTPEAWRSFEHARQLPNVEFHGPIPPSEVVKLIDTFDVHLLIYTDNEFNRSASPMKLWEQLPTGQPIVANRAVPELHLYRDLILLADGAEDFAACLRRALIPDAAMAATRREFAAANTWEARAKTFCHTVGEI